MVSKKVLIICKSVHRGNTMKVAKVIAEKLNAEIKEPSKVNFKNLDKYDLIGFGSGIYNGKHHQNLFKLIDSLKLQKNKKSFIFSTASIRYKKMHEPLRLKLESKGFDVTHEFICRGFMYYTFLKYFGGINRTRPNKKDLENAKEFALDIKSNSK